MKTKQSIFSIIALLLVVAVGIATSQAKAWLFLQPTNLLQVENMVDMGTAFTYQGQLQDDAIPANGIYEFQFVLYDTVVGGSQVGAILTPTLTVTDGLFTAQLDFGPEAFTGEARYLEIGIRPFGSPAPYEILSPRQPLTPAPQAIFAETAESVSWSGITNMPEGFADGIDHVGIGGSITSVNAGDGLLGGGDTGSITLTVAFSGTGTAATVAHSDHTHTIPTYDVLKSFQIDHILPTVGVYDWEAFSIGNDYFLVSANYYNGYDQNLNSNIYRWDGYKFVEIQSIPTQGARDWEFFSFEGNAYLAVANRYNGTTFNLNSQIFHWNGSSFIEIQSIPTMGAHDWEFFMIDNTPYLVVANERSGSDLTVDSKIYQWNGASFVEFQPIPTQGAHDWESFALGDQKFLVVANSENGVSTNVNSTLYQWNGTTFTELQNFSTKGAMDWEFFTVENDAFLAVANQIDETNYEVLSKIYRWDGADFVEFQSFLTYDAHGWEAFEIGSDTYLAIANLYDGNTFALNSRIYKWDGLRFVLEQTIPTIGAADWEFFTMDSIFYLAVANLRDGSIYTQDSVIYQGVLSSRAGELVIGNP